MNNRQPQKPKRPCNAVAEQVVELKTDYSTAVQRLRQLQGVCRETANSALPLFFRSHKNGRFRLVENRENLTCPVFLQGGLYTEEGKTLAALYVCRHNAMRAYIVVSLMIDLAMALFFTFGLIPAIAQGLRPYGIALILLIVAAQIAAAMRQWQRYRAGAKQVEEDACRMTEIVLNRLQTVENWEK